MYSNMLMRPLKGSVNNCFELSPTPQLQMLLGDLQGFAYPMVEAHLEQAESPYLLHISCRGKRYVFLLSPDFFFFLSLLKMNLTQRMQDPLVTSASYSSAEIQAWLAALSTTEFFWNAITNAVAPELFKAGAAAISGALNKVRSNSKTSSSTVSQWPSIFSGLELIANRVTLSHRDGGGAPTLYDLLVSLGIGHNATMKLADLQAELDYSPGTMVYISGRVLEHSVGPWDNGERFVIAHFMRDKVHDRIGVPRPQFPKHTTLLEMVGKEVARNRKKFGH